MALKKWKYNLLFVLLIVLIGCYMGMSFFVDNPSLESQQGSGIDQVSPETPEELPEVEVGDDVDQEEEDYYMPINGISAIIDALDRLKNGAGYSSSFSQTMSNKGTVMNISSTVIQSVDGTIMKGKNSNGETVSVENFFFHSDDTNIGKDQVANYYRGIYVNYDTNTAQVALTSSYDLNNQTYDLSQASRNEFMSVSDLLDEFGIIQGQGFPLSITKQNSTIMNDYTDTIRTIKISFKSSALSTGYLKYWLSNGQLTNLSYNGSDISITFYIQKSNGALVKIFREETFNATASYGPMKVPVTSTITTTQTFKAFDKAITLADSL